MNRGTEEPSSSCNIRRISRGSTRRLKSVYNAGQAVGLNQQGHTDMKRYLLAAASVAAFAAAPAAARDHSAYFGLEVGPMWAQDSHVRFPNFTGDGSADFTATHKLGVDGDLIAGYDFGIIRAELEGAHKWAKHDKYKD